MGNIGLGSQANLLHFSSNILWKIEFSLSTASLHVQRESNLREQTQNTRSKLHFEKEAAVAVETVVSEEFCLILQMLYFPKKYFS